MGFILNDYELARIGKRETIFYNFTAEAINTGQIKSLLPLQRAGFQNVLKTYKHLNRLIGVGKQVCYVCIQTNNNMHNTFKEGIIRLGKVFPMVLVLLISIICWLPKAVQGQDTLAGEAEGVVETVDSLVEETAEAAAEITENQPAEAYARGGYSKQDLRRGERLFKGLVPFGSGAHSCASCHYTSRTDTLNWNPSAFDLALAWHKDPEYRIQQKMNNPTGMRMMTDHLDMTVTLEEERQLEAYYEAILEEGPGELRAYPVNSIIFWGLGVLMLLAVVDLLITKKVRFKAIHMLILIVGLVVHMQYAVAESRNLGRTQGYAPDQPIKFSHLVHAGENAIDCNYCHTVNQFSPSSGIPSNNTCLNCHGVIREGTRSGRFEINKIHQAEESGKPIEWLRIHDLPDHTFYSHAQHVNAGGLECLECHGTVEEMHVLYQHADLSMGWCLTCHRDNDADFVGNPYFGIYKQLHQDIKDGKIDAVKAAQIGGEDCMKCHY